MTKNDAFRLNCFTDTAALLLSKFEVLFAVINPWPLILENVDEISLFI